MRIKRVAPAALAFFGACSSQKAPSSTDSSAIPAPSVHATEIGPSQAAPATACRHDGTWALCSIERRLKQSGYVVKRIETDTARRGGFSVAPVTYTLSKSRLEIFLYRDSASLAHDVAKLDTVTVGPIGKPSQWGEVPPTLIRSANMAAVLLSPNPRQTERVMLALTAGPPQPGSPR